MSTTTATVTATGEPVKKRGRPKKVVDDVGEEVKKTGTRKASTKAAKAAKADEEVGKKGAKTSIKSSAKATKKTELKAAKTTPVAPSSSKILQEVAAKGTLRAGTSATDTSVKTAPTQPAVSASKPTSSTSTSTSPPQAPRASTIPLPSKPLNPNPSTSRPLPYRSPTSTPTSNPITASNSTSPSSSKPAPSPKKPLPEPVLDGQLPPKYKPAARRVTAIIVGIPVIFVTSYELWRRWDGEIRHKFEFREAPKPQEIGAPAQEADAVKPT